MTLEVFLILENRPSGEALEVLYIQFLKTDLLSFSGLLPTLASVCWFLCFLADPTELHTCVIYARSWVSGVAAGPTSRTN